MRRVSGQLAAGKQLDSGFEKGTGRIRALSSQCGTTRADRIRKDLVESGRKRANLGTTAQTLEKVTCERVGGLPGDVVKGDG